MNKLFTKFSNLSRLKKQFVMLVADVCMLLFALWASFSMRLGELYTPQNNEAWLLLLSPFIAIPIFIKVGLYRAIVRYIGFQALWTVIKAVSIYAVIWSAFVFLSGSVGIPRSVTLINWFVAILLIGGSRMIARWWFSGQFELYKKIEYGKQNVVVYGAGTAGMQLVSVMKYSRDFIPVAFIDDNLNLQKQHVNGLPVFSLSEFTSKLEKINVTEVLLAIPSASPERRKQILQMLEVLPVHVRTLPSMSEIADGKIKLEDIKEIEIEDLLGRESVEPDTTLFETCIKSKSVLVTGAGGSIGSELCRQIITRKPKILVLFESSEFNLYKIEQELQKELSDKQLNISLVPVLGDVTNYDQISNEIKKHSINTVYHAAAYKHVPLVEHNIVAGLFNNVFGTYRTALAAKANNVETFILISTDKAVRPTNVMGASKRFAELVLQGLATKEGTTKFSMVRFGNVLGSSGSVVPLFREQIMNGGPVTVTHKDIIRYFMTIPEASQLVIQAGAMGTGGDVFVLDMGEPVKITDLAKKMIHLMGYSVKDEHNPVGDIELQFTGLRPGEKLYEELLIGNNPTGTAHPLIMRAEEESFTWPEMEEFLAQLDKAIKIFDTEAIIKLLTVVVSGYSPQANSISNDFSNSTEKSSVVSLEQYKK